MTEPRTEAGKRLLDWWNNRREADPDPTWRTLKIAAIEAEATAAAEQRLAGLREAARALVDSWYGGEEGPRYLELRDALNALDSDTEERVNG